MIFNLSLVCTHAPMEVKDDWNKDDFFERKDRRRKAVTKQLKISYLTCIALCKSTLRRHFKLLRTAANEFICFRQAGKGLSPIVG